jgi:hypothetical protein
LEKQKFEKTFAPTYYLYTTFLSCFISFLHPTLTTLYFFIIS